MLEGRAGFCFMLRSVRALHSRGKILFWEILGTRKIETTCIPGEWPGNGECPENVREYYLAGFLDSFSQSL
jgi:hypothetical protein